MNCKTDRDLLLLLLLLRKQITKFNISKPPNANVQKWYKNHPKFNSAVYKIEFSFGFPKSNAITQMLFYMD